MTTPKVLQIIGFKNSGKTTLICRLIEKLSDQGVKVGTIKHDGHDFEMDQQGTDTWLHRQSGAKTVAITSDFRSAWFTDQPMSMEELLQQMTGVELVLVEGFKQENGDKLILARTDDELEQLLRLTKVRGVVLGPDCHWQAKLPAFVERYRPGEIELISRWIRNELNI